MTVEQLLEAQLAEMEIQTGLLEMIASQQMPYAEYQMILYLACGVVFALAFLSGLNIMNR